MEARAIVGDGGVNIGKEFTKGTDHRVVCIIKQNKFGFKQNSVKSIRPGMGCRAILVRRSRREKTTWWHRLWRNILLEPNKL